MRENLKDKKRIVFKVGSSTLTHKETCQDGEICADSYRFT